MKSVHLNNNNNHNILSADIDEDNQLPKSSLDLLHQTCERLLNECANRNRKPLKFRYIEITSMDHNCNYNQKNRMNSSVNDLDKTNTFTVDIQNNTSECSNEILDYSMKQMKYHYYASNTTSPLYSTASSNLHNSSPTFPFSCFTSSAFKFSNLPFNSLNDILILLQQGLIDPEVLLSNVNILQQQSTSSYFNPTKQTLKQDNPENENYFENLKLISYFLSYLSLLKCLHSSNTTDCSNILNGSISGTSGEDSNI
ncbi:unnamed protein product [Schistosoma rodhaini]|uniref:Uncharacterized protein n=2 Tax=Schistosoma rodhaini TaxID=6188 RepID=A0AA85GEM1_9TREM|nr:unnamed protein product [Schistosoma rodhaini]